MVVDVVYVAHNRLAFTTLTFEALIANTSWDRVRRLVVYDDASDDGTWEYLQARAAEPDMERVEVLLHHGEFGSPVTIMNHYVDHTPDSDFFAKVDNDIMCPAGWLDAMLGVLDGSPALQVLGMEAGRMGPPEPGELRHSWEAARWIGGVGVIQTKVLGQTRRMKANGRFGWTEHQKEFKPVIGWIKPDLAVCSLDQIPFEPWATYSASYNEREWQREWPQYFAEWMSWYWRWWAPEEKG